MNRFIKALLLALSFTMVMSAVALAATWDFKYPTTATDNTSTTRTYYSVLLGYGGQQLIDNEKILPSGLDTNIQIGSTDVDYMMSTDQVTAIISTLPSNGSVNLDLYTGYSPVQTGFPIIIGDGGYITVSDDASMEMGDNFTLTISGAILDTDNGSNKNPWYKENALELHFDESTSGTLTLDIFGDTEILRPNGVGYVTGLLRAPAVDNYLNVDDVTPDDDSTYVSAPVDVGVWYYDGYEITDTSLPTNAVIQSIQVTQRVRNHTADGGQKSVTGLRLGGVNSLSSEHDPTGTGYIDYTDTITRPGGGNWSVSDLNSLQVIIGLTSSAANTILCTQTYITVNYYVSISVTGLSDIEGDIIASLTPAELFEDFEWGNDGDDISTSGGGVTWQHNGTGSSVAEIDTAQSYNGTRSMRIYRDGTNNVAAYTVRATEEGKGRELYFRKDDNSGSYIQHGHAGKYATVYINSAESIYSNGVDTGYDVDVDTWHLISLENLDWTNGIFDLYLDGVLIDEDSVMATGATYNDNLAIWNVAGTSEIWIDDIYDSNYLTLNVDGEYENCYIIGNGVPDNANDIIIMQGNSFVKADSIELEVDGVAVATYEPTSMLSGATLNDETGTNDGTITWGSNTGVEITYGTMESSIESEGGSPVTGNATLPTAFMPATWFAMGENIENLPFYDMVYNAVSSMDFPDVTEGVQTIYLIVIYGTSLLAFLLIVLFTRSALLGFSAMEIVLFVGSSMTIIPMWIPVAILLVGIGIMFLYRQVSY